MTQHPCCVILVGVIPPFDHRGLLPAGIHWATWSEITSRFGINAHRRRQLDGLERGAAALAGAGCPALFLDGSFSTDKDIPGDYDACYEMLGVRVAHLDPVFLDFSNKRAAQKAKYFGEYFPAAVTATSSPHTTYLNFFQQDKATGEAKGIVGLNLITP